MWQQDTFQLDNRLLNSSYHLPSNYVLGVNIGASDPVIAAAAAAAAAVNLTTLLSCGIKDSSLSWQQTSPATTTNLVQSPLSITSESSSNSTHSSECTTSSSVKQLQGNYTSAWSVNHTVADPSYFMSDKIDTNVNTTSAGDWWSKDQQQQQASQWNNFTQAPPSNLSDMEGGDWPSQLGCLGTAPEVNEQLSKMAAMEQADYSSSTTLVESDIASNPGSWILLTGEGNDSGEPALDEGLHEAFNGLKKVESSTWEFPLKNQGFEMEDIKFGSHHQLDFSLGPEDRRMLDLENWNMSETQPRSSNFSMDVYNGNTAMDQRQFDPSKIKQEMDVYYSPMIGSNNNIPMQCSSDNFKSSGLTDLLGGSMISPAPGNSRWGTHSSRLPAMLSQLPNLEMPSTSSSPKHVNLFGTRPFTNYPSSSAKPAEQFKMQRMSESSMSQHSSVTSQHSYDSKDTHAGIISSKQMMEEGSREVSSDQKRSVPTTEHTSETFFKRPRIEQNPSLPLKVRKEKLGERITALQQLVSPFGKTDTASVLLEAIGYIKFLHDQIQVLSTPYMKNNANPSRSKDAVAAKGSWSTGISSSSAGDIKTKESDRPDLRSRGLCLVPLSCTLQVASDNNGADYWAPSIGGNSAK